MKNIFILLFFISITSCKKNRQINTENLVNGYTINATISSLPDSLKVYIVDRNQHKNEKFLFIDSTYTKNGTFILKGKIDKPLLIAIGFRNPKTNQFLEHGMSFWLENANIAITGSFNDFENSEIEGSQINDIVNKVAFDAKIKMMFECNKFYKNEAVKNSKVKEDINKVYEKFANLKKKQHWSFVFNNPNQDHSIITVLSHKKNGIPIDSFKLFYERLNPQFKRSVNGQKLKKYLTYKKLKNGDLFTDFEAKDLDGKIVRLSDFEGKVILLDFGASWCASCREFSRNVIPKFINKFDKKDFLVINYSLDRSEKRWRKMVEKDKINWVSLSNLEGVNDDVALKYDIQEIPDFVLIDKKGRIYKSISGSVDIGLLEKRIDSLVRL